MSLTGYITQNGIDLSFIFQSGNSGIQTNYFLNGNVAEIIGYKDAHIDKATRETIEGYLAWKWGIQGKLPNTHTYYSSAPT